MIEVNVLEDPLYHPADNRLGGSGRLSATILFGPGIVALGPPCRICYNTAPHKSY
jgi:hypothetical protein